MTRFAGRALDKLYFLFLVMHIPATLCIDMQPLYPSAISDSAAFAPLRAVLEWYMSTTRDPVLGGALSGRAAWAWLRTFFALEGGFQLPCFVLGAWGLWKNDRRIYPLLVAYGASTATTLLPVLNAVLAGVEPQPPLNGQELGMLLSSYLPFLFVPLLMAVELGWRLVGIVGRADAAKQQ